MGCKLERRLPIHSKATKAELGNVITSKKNVHKQNNFFPLGQEQSVLETVT